MPHQGYQSGGAYGYCDRCAEVTRLRLMRVEWSGSKVCPRCFDPRPPQLEAPSVYPEGLPLPGSRPEPDIVELDDNDLVTGADL